MRRMAWTMAAIMAILMMTFGSTVMAEEASEGQLAALAVTMTEDEVTRGDYLELRVHNLEDYEAYAYYGAYKISAYVSTACGSDGSTYACNPWGYIRIPTQSLNASELQETDQGQFTVTVVAYDGEGNSATWTDRFSVMEPETGTLNFHVSTAQAVTGETYSIAAYAPGAFKIEVYDIYDDMKFASYGEELYATDGYNFRDTFSYWARAFFRDEDSGEESTVVSDTLTVNVTAESDVPSISVAFDQILVAGEDLVFSLPAEGTGVFTNWNLRVIRISTGEVIMHRYRSEYEDSHEPLIVGEAYEIRIPTRVAYTEYDEAGNPVEAVDDLLQPGEAYDIELGFFQYNRHGFSFDVPMLVVGSETLQDSVAMTVNGQTGTFHAAAHQDVSFRVQGPDEATGLLIFEGYDWNFHEGNTWEAEWGWWTNNHIPEYLFYAKYTAEPIPDGEYDWRSLSFSDSVSNLVILVNDTQGYLPLPAFALNTTGEGEIGEIAQGEMLEVTIANLDDYSGYENVRFFAMVYDSVTGEVFGERIYGEGTATLQIPTDIIDPSIHTGHAFTLEVTATTDSGWYQGTSSAQFNLVITDDGGLKGTLTADDTHKKVFENLHLYAEVPGATAVALYDGFGFTCCPGTTAEAEIPMWDPGEYTFYARYTTQEIPSDDSVNWEDVDWEGETNAVTVTVDEPGHELEDLQATLVSDAVSRGVPLVVTVTNENPGLEVSYGAHLVAPGEDFSDYAWFGADGQQKIQVSTAEVEPGEYDLIISANAVDCYGKILRMPVTVLSPQRATAVLVLPTDLKVISEEAFAGVAAEKILVPEGVEVIESRAFADCPNLFELELPSGIAAFAPDALEGSSAFVYGAPGSDQQGYADEVENLYFVSVE